MCGAASCAAEAQTSDEYARKYICSSSYPTSRVTLYVPKNVLTGNGGAFASEAKLVLNGDTYIVEYMRTGATHYWMFQESVYIQLDPDMKAMYYDFTGAEDGEKRSPRSMWDCK